MLCAYNLIKTFERHEKGSSKKEFNAVDDISLCVNSGEIVGVLGPNGAGKTTLLRMLGKLMSPTQGRVVYMDGDREISDDLEIKRRIGYLSGNTRLYGRLSTRELLKILGDIYNIGEAELDGRIADITEVLSLGEFIDNRIEKLSTGQTQRASISRCLIHNPETYIFDEPTLGLDILSSSAIIEFMKQEREKGKAIVYSTHYMEEAEYLCDKVILIDNGRIVEQGTVEALKEKLAADSLREVFGRLTEGGAMSDEV